MTWWAASLISNACIMAIEYMNRQAQGGWLEVLPQTAPFIILAQFCLFRAFNDAPHWMVAWLVFALGNNTMRVTLVYATGQPIASWPLILAGVAGMIASSYVLKQGLH